jgi:hypothetical protein
MIIPNIVVKVEGDFLGLDLNTTIIFVIIAYTLAQMQTYPLLRVSDYPWTKIRIERCVHVWNIKRTYIFPSNSDSTEIC